MMDEVEYTGPRDMPGDVAAAVRALYEACPWLREEPATRYGHWTLRGTYADVVFRVEVAYPAYTAEEADAAGDMNKYRDAVPNFDAPTHWTLAIELAPSMFAPDQPTLLSVAESRGSIVPLREYLARHMETFIEDDALLLDEGAGDADYGFRDEDDAEDTVQLMDETM
jgi:hypothetical protein